MGAFIPQHLVDTDWSIYLAGQGLKRFNQGKTRDLYEPDKDRLLIVASDRISIFEYVLATAIPRKGEVLTALTHFWPTQVLGQFPNHLAESKKYPGKNAVLDLADELPGLPVERSLVVDRVEILPFELIFRHHIGGSVYGKYLETGKAGGVELPPNLPKWYKLETPIFTPSTKEELGHDINVDADYFYERYREDGYQLVEMMRSAFKQAYAYGAERGIIILDTKFEGCFFRLADELLTPDSSRFCRASNWSKAMAQGREPDFLDKQVVRDWGAKLATPFKDKNGKPIIGLKDLEPTNPEHIGWVHQLIVPAEIVKTVEQNLLDLFHTLTGMPLVEYQKQFLFKN